MVAFLFKDFEITLIHSAEDEQTASDLFHVGVFPLELYQKVIFIKRKKRATALFINKSKKADIYMITIYKPKYIMICVLKTTATKN